MADATQKFVNALQRVFEDREARARDVNPARVVGRNEDGTSQLMRLDGECISRGGEGGYNGEIVSTLPAIEHREGTAGIPLLSRRDSTELIVVDHLEPRDFPQGATALAVDVIGTGFSATTTFEFFLPASEDLNPSIEIVSKTFVDSELVSLVLNIAADAEIFDQAPLGYADAPRGFIDRRKGDAYGVTDPALTEGPTITHEYGIRGFCYRGLVARIARLHITSDDAVPVSWALEFVSVQRSVMPHLEISDGTLFLSVPLTEDEATDMEVFSMQNGPGGSFYIWYTKNLTEVRLARIYYTGSIAKEISYSADITAQQDSSLFFPTELINVAGPKLFTAELIEGAGALSGPPFSSHLRLTRRHAYSLDVEESYTVPNPSSKDGWTIRTSGVSSFAYTAGRVRVYFFYIKQPPGGADTKIFYQDFDLDLALAGTDAPDPTNPSPVMGYGNGVASYPGGGIIFVVGTKLYRRNSDLSTTSIVLTPYDDDGGQTLGIAQLDDTQTLICGGGALFTTSILKPTGQELPLMIEIYEDDDTTLVEDFPIPDFEAGADSTPFTVHVWNSIGDSFEQAALNAVLALYMEHLSTPDLFVRSGFPPVDEMWARFRIVGFDSTGDSTFTVNDTDWKVIGANAVLELGDIPANCAVYVEILFHPPATAATVPYRFGLGVLKDDYAVATAPGLSDVDRGILPLVGDFAETEILSGGVLTQTATADANVQISAVQAIVAGALFGAIKTSLSLNQNDSAAAALTAGQSYYATISYGSSGWQATKGLRSTTPIKVAVPAGDRLRGYVKVDYQAGTSVIETADIENTGLYGRYYAEAGSGLELKIHRGSAIGGGTRRFSVGYQTIALPASDTSYVYQLASGLFDIQDAEQPPETTALGCWYEVDTNGSAVTAIRDRRKFAGRTRMITLKGATPGAPGSVDDMVVEEDELWIEEIFFRVSDNGAGASGLTKADVKKNGTTLFTSNVTEDQRPTIAYNASTLYSATRFHEVTRAKRGDVLSFFTATHPTGGNPARVELSLLCRIP